MPKTNYERNRALNGRYGDGTYSKPATVYFGLFNDMPTVAGGGTEVSGPGYSRVAVTNDSNNFPDPVDGVTANANMIEFAEASGSWGTIPGAGIWDSLVGGNLQDFAPFNTPQTVLNGTQFRIHPGQMVLQET